MHRLPDGEAVERQGDTRHALRVCIARWCSKAVRDRCLGLAVVMTLTLPGISPLEGAMSAVIIRTIFRKTLI